MPSLALFLWHEPPLFDIILSLALSPMLCSSLSYPLLPYSISWHVHTLACFFPTFHMFSSLLSSPYLPDPLPLEVTLTTPLYIYMRACLCLLTSSRVNSLLHHHKYLKSDICGFGSILNLFKDVRVAKSWRQIFETYQRVNLTEVLTVDTTRRC